MDDRTELFKPRAASARHGQGHSGGMRALGMALMILCSAGACAALLVWWLRNADMSPDKTGMKINSSVDGGAGGGTNYAQLIETAKESAGEINKKTEQLMQTAVENGHAVAPRSAPAKAR